MVYSRLQYISQGKTADEQLENISLVLDAGCTWVQLRFKTEQLHDILEVAHQARKLTRSYHSTLIINDHPHIAKEVDADGVHLGLSDMSIDEARQIVGQSKIIGGTANTYLDVAERIKGHCNYIGLGPLFHTTTKEKLSPRLGVDGLARIMEQIAAQGNQMPVFAIGGIKLEDVLAILNTGVAGVAVSGDITQCADKKEWINKFKILTNG